MFEENCSLYLTYSLMFYSEVYMKYEGRICYNKRGGSWNRYKLKWMFVPPVDLYSFKVISTWKWLSSWTTNKTERCSKLSKVQRFVQFYANFVRWIIKINVIYTFNLLVVSVEWLQNIIFGENLHELNPFEEHQLLWDQKPT